MTAFAYYRLPYLHHATFVAQHEGKPEVLTSVAELNGKEGFVIAPFSPSSDCPVLLIHSDEKRLIAVGTEKMTAGLSDENSELESDEKSDKESYKESDKESDRKSYWKSDKESYAKDFECFHKQLQKDAFRKIVLARIASDKSLKEVLGKNILGKNIPGKNIPGKNIPGKKVQGKEEVSNASACLKLFLRACRMYPRLFVALVYTPQSGMWLMATPEILLKGDGDEYSTMSLAGTQKAEPSPTVADYPVEGVEWSKKNREEQQYVTDYIEQCVQAFASDYSLKGPYTTMAANLYHLRTYISFRLKDSSRLGDVLEKLYPTPAVCGIPKEETRRFILEHESQPRKYYSGFVGPLSPSGKTHLFVSLRCMNILEDGICQLYAGGGLLKESEMEKEWRETEAKMQTIRNVIFNV